MSSILDDSIRQLETAADHFGSAVVAYSGGKDSLVCLDLTCRFFPPGKVYAFFMWFLPDMDCMRASLAYAHNRWHIHVWEYPHWDLGRLLREGVYTIGTRDTDELPDFQLNDIFNLAKVDTGARCVIRGSKKSDSVWRRRTLSRIKREDIIHPIADWNKYDVLSYLKVRDIPLPDSPKGNASGIDMKDASLLWLAEKWPRDFEYLCSIFPFAEAVIWREKFYGRKLKRT